MRNKEVAQKRVWEFVYLSFFVFAVLERRGLQVGRVRAENYLVDADRRLKYFLSELFSPRLVQQAETSKTKESKSQRVETIQERWK